MEIFGITGGIGMGKSAAGDILRSLGISVIDTDQLARDVVAPGTPGLAEVLAEFGPEFADEHGGLRREALGQRVFADSPALIRLNALVHPRIRAAWQAQLATWRAAGIARAAVIIPLLYENGYDAELQWVACVACTASTQRMRLRDRGWSDGEIDRRIASQLPTPEKMARAQRVVWTEGSRAAHAAQWPRVLASVPSLFNPIAPV